MENISILISVQSEHLINILSDLKILEIRKRKTRLKLPVTVYLYCPKSTPKSGKLLCRGISPFTNEPFYFFTNDYDPSFQILNGTIVGCFTLNKIEEIEFYDNQYSTSSFSQLPLLQNSCLEYEQMHQYFNKPKSYQTAGYAWHISDLVKFDTPLHLSDFNLCDQNPITGKYRPVKKPPQSFFYVLRKEVNL